MPTLRITILLLFACPFSLCSQQEAITIEQQLKEVSLLVDSAQLSRALELNRKILMDYNRQSVQQDTSMAKIHNSMSFVFLNMIKPDSGFVYANNALDILKAAAYRNHDLRAKSHMYCGLAHERRGQLNKALEAYKFGLEIIHQNHGKNHLKAVSLYINSSICYNLVGQPKKAIDYLEKTLNILQDQDQPNLQQLAFVYNNLGGIYSTVEDYDRARDYHVKSYELLKNLIGPNHPHLYTSFLNIGMNSLKRGDIEESRIYVQKGMAILRDNFGEHHPNFATAHAVLGMVYSKSKNYTKAIEQFEKGLKVSEINLGPKHHRVGEIYFSLAEAHARMKNYTEAIRCTKKSQQIFLADRGNNSKRLEQSHMILGDIYYSKGDHDQAIAYYDNALNFSRAQSLKGPNVAKPHLYIARSLSHKGEFSKAQQSFSASARILQYDFRQPINFDRVNNVLLLKELLTEKRHDYLRQYQRSQNKIYLDSILQNDQHAMALEDYFQSELSEQKARSFHLADDFWRYEQAIENLIQRGREEDFRLAFTISEKSKARLLAERFRATKAKKILGISKELLDREHQVDVDLAYYDQKLFQAQEDEQSPSDSIVENLQAQLFSLKQEKKSLVKTFREKYPAYHDLKYAHSATSISTLQSLLQKDQALLEYFVGDSTIFVFVITPDHFTVKSLEKNFPLTDWVRELRENILSYWILANQSDSTYKKNNASYVQIAHDLYEKIIAPVESILPEKLIIVPDGALNFVPFDALLRELPQDPLAHKDHAYLIKDYQISYNYSASLYKELLQRKEATAQQLNLVFAPAFDESATEGKTLHELRNGFHKLKYNLQEAEAVRSLLGGDLVAGAAATEKHFLEIADQYRIIHLSTHGKSNDQVGDYSFIAFSEIKDSVTDNERLYVRELYNLQLNADMVVLSACETGLGEIKRGEGIVGLARGFTYAGAASTITSLWSVNDIQTTYLMERFYKNIKAGLPKDAALRQAKLSYLEEENHADPFFWSAFVASGNMAPIQLRKPWATWQMGLAALGLSLIGLLIWRFTKASKAPQPLAA